jgi:hypothetical protein
MSCTVTSSLFKCNTLQQVPLSSFDTGSQHWYIVWALVFPTELNGELLRLSLSRLFVRYL